MAAFKSCENSLCVSSFVLSRALSFLFLLTPWRKQGALSNDYSFYIVEANASKSWSFSNRLLGKLFLGDGKRIQQNRERIARVPENPPYTVPSLTLWIHSGRGGKCLPYGNLICGEKKWRLILTCCRPSVWLVPVPFFCLLFTVKEIFARK